MGIKNLSQILNTKCACAINQRNLASYSGMVVGVDVSIYLYKYLYNNDDHLEGLIRLILRLMKNSIMPLFVFDGKPPKEKAETLLERRERREGLVEKKNIYERCIENKAVGMSLCYDDFKKKLDGLNVTDDEVKELYQKSTFELQNELSKVVRKIIYVTSAHIESSKKLLDLFGISYIVSDGEAESLIAALCKANYIDACISEDTDILVNGGHIFLRNFNADTNYVQEYCLEGVLNTLELTYDQFVDMCILCGSDYTGKIEGIGPVNAYKLTKKFGSLELVIDHIKITKKFVIPDNFDYVTARKLFKEPFNNNVLNSYKKNIKIGKPNLHGLLELVKTTKIKEKYIEEITDSVELYYKNIINAFK